MQDLYDMRKMFFFFFETLLYTFKLSKQRNQNTSRISQGQLSKVGLVERNVKIWKHYEVRQYLVEYQ